MCYTYLYLYKKKATVVDRRRTQMRAIVICLRLMARENMRSNYLPQIDGQHKCV